MVNRLSCRAIGLALLISVCVATTGRADGRFAEAHLIMGKQQVRGVLASDAKLSRVTFEAEGSVPFEIPFTTIRTLRYERASKPRYAAAVLVAWPLIFTKSKQHYLTIQYLDASGEGKYQIVRLSKDNVRVALDTLEADTGLKIERFEER